MPLPQRPNPYLTFLNEAASRLFQGDVALADDLLRDAAATLYALSVTPEKFGILKPYDNPETRQVRLANLINAGGAFVQNHRKYHPSPIHRPELELPKPKP